MSPEATSNPARREGPPSTHRTSAIYTPPARRHTGKRHNRARAATTPPPTPSLLHPADSSSSPRLTSLPCLLPSLPLRRLLPAAARNPACERAAAARRRPERHGQVRGGSRHRVGQLRGGAADAQPGDPRARRRQAHRARPPGPGLALSARLDSGVWIWVGSAGARIQWFWFL